MSFRWKGKFSTLRDMYICEGSTYRVQYYSRFQVSTDGPGAHEGDEGGLFVHSPFANIRKEDVFATGFLSGNGASLPARACLFVACPAHCCSGMEVCRWAFHSHRPNELIKTACLD